MKVNRTQIEWVKNPDGSQGYTWNPITGCLDGCTYCYARRLAEGRLRGRYLANKNFAPARHIADGHWLDDPFYPRFWPERLEDIPITGGWWDSFGCRKPKGIFVCDMSDLFGIGIPKDWQQQIFDAIRSDQLDRFYLLTKQPQNLARWSPFPSNAWPGVTITNQAQLSDSLRGLLGVDASIKYISFEPLLGPINVTFFPREINWVIVGAQTKPLVLPNREWIDEIVSAADKAGAKVFLKDNLRPLIDKHYPAESILVPNHNKLVRTKHPSLCDGCKGEFCSKCGVIWGLRQEVPK